jgi:ElaB/YqjD/DUF883 family membrane-anchored ribosome-binding protein
MISRLELEEHWDSIRAAVQAQWPTLGGEELQEARHSAGHFVGLIQQRTDDPREDIERFLESVVCPVQSFVRQTSATLRNAPLTATAVALGAGFLIGIATTALMAPSKR